MRLALLSFLIISLQLPKTLWAFQYPKPPSNNTTQIQHGVVVRDPFRPLEKTHNPQVRKWVQMQNLLAKKYFKSNPCFKPILSFLEKTDKEMSAISSPIYAGNHYFSIVNNSNELSSQLYRSNTLDSSQQAVLKFNKRIKFKNMGAYLSRLSFDGRFFLRVNKNYRTLKTTIKIYDIKQGKMLADKISHVGRVEFTWSPDSKGIYYVAYNQNATYHASAAAIYYHKIRTPMSEDQLVKKIKGSKIVKLYTFKNDHYLFLSLQNYTTGNKTFYYKTIATDLSKPRKITLTDQSINRPIGHIRKSYFFLTTSKSGNDQIVKINLDNNKKYETVIKSKSDSPIEKVYIANKKLIIIRLINVTPHIEIYSILNTKKLYGHKLPIGSISNLTIDNHHHQLFISFQSYLIPPIVYSLDLDTFKMKVHSQVNVKQLGLTKYVLKQVWYKAEDGTQIPMTLVYTRGMKQNSQNPLMLYAYGGFRNRIKPTFSPAVIAWLKMGGIFAVPALRGGGELGKHWHTSAILENKVTTFNDYTAAMRYLIIHGYTNPKKLVISGNSNGGLSAAVMLTSNSKRLFAAASINVAVLDMLRFHISGIGRFWSNEYGSAENASSFFNLLNYSPLNNVRKGVTYPATLITTAKNDITVQPFHSYKFTAALQESQAGKAPILLMNFNSSHSLDTAKSLAAILAFFADATHMNCNHDI